MPIRVRELDEKFDSLALRVLVADGDPLLRKMVRRALEAEDDIKVVGEVTEGDEIIEAIGDLSPDIVLMDLEILGREVDFQGHMLDDFPTTRVIAWTTDNVN